MLVEASNPLAIRSERGFGSLFVAGGVVALCLTAVIPAATLHVNGSYVAAVGLGLLASVAIASTERMPFRATSLTLFLVALVVRLLAASAFFYFGVHGGGPYLGPDSMTYYDGGIDLAARGFHIDEIPLLYFGTYDVAHFYLFAAAVKYLGADLFGLQILNSVLTAIAAQLTFGAVRVFMPQAALIIAAIVAFDPSLIVLSTVELLKDPSIVCAMLLLVWCVLRLTQTERLAAMLPYTVLGFLAGVYLRTGRFYSFAYLEVAFVAAAAFMVIWRRARVFTSRRALVMTLAIFVGAEIVPAVARWPPSPLLMATQIRAAGGMTTYGSGLLDRLPRRHRASERQEGTVLRPFANVFRRLYGPFVWILPERWAFVTLQSGDYLLYPGMLVWYAVLPAIAAGLILTGVRVSSRTEGQFAVVFLWFFVTVYFAQYLVINLSYRQRQAILPMLLIFGYIGFRWASTQRLAWRVYAVYWLALACIAATHLLARAALAA